jgi:excisionase family DNA binding protein
MSRPRLKPRSMKRKVTPPVSSIAHRLLIVPQAAQYLNIVPWVIRSLHLEGKVRGIKIGRRLLFDKTALDVYVGRLFVEAKSKFS